MAEIASESDAVKRASIPFWLPDVVLSDESRMKASSKCGNCGKLLWAKLDVVGAASGFRSMVVRHVWLGRFNITIVSRTQTRTA